MDTTLMRVYNKCWEIEKEKLHQRPGSFPQFHCPEILWASQPMCPSSFLVLPSFINLRTRFLLRGEGCNTSCYKNHHYRKQGNVSRPKTDEYMFIDD
jgi:hypothetical protein